MVLSCLLPQGHFWGRVQNMLVTTCGQMIEEVSQSQQGYHILPYILYHPPNLDAYEGQQKTANCHAACHSACRWFEMGARTFMSVTAFSASACVLSCCGHDSQLQAWKVSTRSTPSRYKIWSYNIDLKYLTMQNQIKHHQIHI